METTIKRKLSLLEIETLFNSSEIVNIRYYEPTTFEPIAEEKIFFNIKVRHCENVKASDDFNKALKYLKLKNKLSDLKDRLHKENLRENEMLSNRGWGYAMRNVKIGFSTTKSDNLKNRLAVVSSELEKLENDNN